MKLLKSILMFFHGFIGIGALFGGVFAMSNPSGIGFGMPATVYLKGSPFTDFFIPGIFLFVVIGLGNIVAFFIAKSNHKYQYYSSGCLGLILCMWIVIQCYIISAIVPLHIAFFIFGVIQIILSIYLHSKKNNHCLFTE